jgi:uncharacterized SAM-binding protein YcdF (DUF218 family)
MMSGMAEMVVYSGGASTRRPVAVRSGEGGTNDFARGQASKFRWRLCGWSHLCAVRFRAMTPLAIVVLGNTNDENGVLAAIPRERCEQAVIEFRKRPGAKVITTGGWGSHFNLTAKPHAAYTRAYLQTLGIPGDAFVESAESGNTVEDATLCRPIVARHGFRRLIVVTSDFHLERARFLFTREFPELTLEFVASRTNLPPEKLQPLIEHEQRALARLGNEAAAGDSGKR